MMKPGSLQIGYRDLLRVALPISAGTALQFLVLLTDNFFLARHSEAAINGAGNAGLVYMTLEMLAMGSSAALQIIIARRIGENSPEEALRTLRTGLIIHAVLGISLLVAGACLNQGFLGSTIQDPDIRSVFENYFNIRLLGFIPFSMLLALNAFYTGTAKTWPILVVAAVTGISNILLDAAWVEGWFWSEAYGYTGAAWASITAESAGCIVSGILLVRTTPKILNSLELLTPAKLKVWWELAYPLMSQFVITIATWTAFFFFVEKVGSLELKVSHITRNFFMLAFITAQGIQQTTRTYVSGLIGENRAEELKLVLKRLTILNAIGTLVLCHGYILYPKLLAAAFFTNEIGIEAMQKTLFVVFIGVSIYTFSGIMLSTIQGLGKTKRAFRIELIAVSIYIVTAAALTLIWPQPIWIIWLVEWVYFSGIGLGSWLYLRKLDWNQLSHEINAQ
jgi:putative MATE family efflux protein